MIPATPDSIERGAPAWGGFNVTALALEVRRVLRNRRTVMFIVVFPSVFFLVFGLSGKQVREAGPTAIAYVMISMAVYGAMVGTTAGGAAVSVERSLGWSRQLRLTPLPAGRVCRDEGADGDDAPDSSRSRLPILQLVQLPQGVRMAPEVWLLSGLGAWVCSLVFAAFGLFVGFLLPSENVMQVVGPLLAILAMFGGLFIPLQALPHLMQTIAMFTPVYGVGQIARAPLVGGLTAVAVAGVVVWTILFGAGAMYLYRRDTARV